MPEVLAFVRENHGVWSLVAVFVAALLEYLVPPLPADSAVLASSLLIVAGVYPFETVYLVAVVGGVAGALIHFLLGRGVARYSGGRVGRWLGRRVGNQGLFERFMTAFRRHGMWVMALNRAMPGIRGICFIAAGAVGLPALRTMAFGLISNLAWTFLILLAGVSVGGQWSKIEAAFGVYRNAVYVVVASALLSYFILRFVRARRRRPRSEAAKPS
ncbi:MAG: VTT domain-containing protein [Deltaproteobacteria bacterium]|nr:VTT domain-containing protein [Deltaproteobacteria bacterium]